MGQAAEERMTHDIDRTRQDLSRDVDALYDKVAPSRVVGRRTQAVRGRFASMKESVMGSAHSAGDSAQGMGHSVASGVSGATSTAADAASSVQDAAGSAVHTVQRRTEGSPIGAGLVAFGAGMVLSALIPASEKEAQVAHKLTEAAKDSALADEAKAVGQQVGQELKESATQAAQEVKQTAQESAQHVADEGRSAAGDVRRDAPGT